MNAIDSTLAPNGSYSSCLYLVRRYGPVLAAKPVRRERVFASLTPNQKMEVVGAYRAGDSMRALAARYGCSVGYIFNIVKTA